MRLTIRGESTTIEERTFVLPAELVYELSDLLFVRVLDANANDRWPGLIRSRQDGVKVRVECDDHSIFSNAQAYIGGVGLKTETYLDCVDCFVAHASQLCRREVRDVLVQQQSHSTKLPGKPKQHSRNAPPQIQGPVSDLPLRDRDNFQRASLCRDR